MQLYYKTVGGKEIFSYCQVVQMNDGTWVSNPSAAQIKAAGWKKYTPPTPVPTPETEPQFDVMLNAVKRMLDSQVEGLTDEDAKMICDFVWDKYGSYSDSTLVTMLHSPGTPWKDVYVEGQNNVIPDDLTKEYYTRISNAIIRASKEWKNKTGQ